MIPIAKPLRRAGGGGGGARGRPVRLAEPGTAGRGLRGGVRRSCRRAARLRGLELHHRAAPRAAWPSASVRGTRWSPSAIPSSPRANAIRQCGAHAGLRRHRGGRLQHRSALVAAAITPRTRAILVRPPDGHALRSGGAAGDRPRARPAADRGCRLRHRLGNPCRRGMAADRRGLWATSSASPSTPAR